MMKLIYLFSTALLAIPFVCDAQPREEFLPPSSKFEVAVPDTFSLDEMKHLWTTLSQAAPPLSRPKGRGFRLPKSPSISCPKLKAAENDLMMEYGVWDLSSRCSTEGEFVHFLYLVDIVSPGDSLTDKGVYNKLLKLYGRDSCGILAKWAVGNIFFLSQPRPYLNTKVSCYSWVTKVEKGKIVGRYELTSKGRYRREADLFSLTLDGVWVDERITYELFLFAHEMNLDMDLDPVHRVVSYFDVEVLLYIDGLGRASIHPLQYEKELDDYQKEQFSKLQDAVSKLPPWRFGVLYNADGRIFPGRYLTADFTRGQGWRFKDYLLK